jgi:crotonobetainyl-CoA:carnitine CoA-transferase CaiB-like acyl-CoA transferase
MIDLLAGIRIIAISQFGAGPFGTLHLSDLGAEVIKIENPREGGDVGRSVPPYVEGRDSLYFQSLNRNKRSITLDLKLPAGKQVLHDLVRVSDGVFSNLRGDLPQKLGLTYDQLASFNPRIVCCSLSGFGTTGPRHSEPAYDYLIQGLAGWMSLTGDPSMPPAKSGISVVDFSAGVVAMLGLAAGLLHAQREGRGCDVDVSLHDTAISMLNYVAAWTLNRDYQPKRLPDSAHPSLYPAQVFETKDSYIIVLCFKEKFWILLTQIMGADDLATEPRYATFADRYENRETLIADLKSRFKLHTTQEWITLLQGQVPCAPVKNVQEALADEQVLAREMVIEIDHPIWGALRQVDTAIRIPDARRHRQPAPSLGIDTELILQEYLGYSPQQIDELRQNDVI